MLGGGWVQEISRTFDDDIEDRLYDNWQFVEFHRVMKDNPETPEASFAIEALSEVR